MGPRLDKIEIKVTASKVRRESAYPLHRARILGSKTQGAHSIVHRVTRVAFSRQCSIK